MLPTSEEKRKKINFFWGFSSSSNREQNEKTEIICILVVSVHHLSFSIVVSVWLVLEGMKHKICVYTMLHLECQSDEYRIKIYFLQDIYVYLVSPPTIGHPDSSISQKNEKRIRRIKMVPMRFTHHIKSAWTQRKHCCNKVRVHMHMRCVPLICTIYIVSSENEFPLLLSLLSLSFDKVI